MRVPLAQLNALGIAVRAAHPMPEGGDRAKSAVIGARWAALDAGLRAIGVEPYRPDETGCMRNGEPHHWHTTQLVDGRICGRWSGSAEQAAAEAAESWGVEVAWTVRDDYPTPVMEHYRRKYAVGRGAAVVAPVTDAPETVVEPAPPVVQPALW